MRHKESLPNHDTPLAAALRFALEVAAWLAIHALWGWWAVITAVLGLALFNKRGDKHVRGIPVPGAARLLLELALLLVGAWAMARWLGPLAGGAMLASLFALVIVGRARYRWLLGQ